MFLFTVCTVNCVSCILLFMLIYPCVLLIFSLVTYLNNLFFQRFYAVNKDYSACFTLSYFFDLCLSIRHIYKYVSVDSLLLYLLFLHDILL